MNQDEFTDFFGVVYPGLLRFVNRLVDPDTADEICSETMATLWSKRLDAPVTEDDWDGLRALTYLVAKGHLRNQGRSHQRRQSLVSRLTSRRARDDDMGHDVAHDILGGIHAVAHLLALPPHEAHVLALALDGYTNAEIAAILGCSPNAVKTRAMRARNTLKTVVEKEHAHES